MSAEPLTSREIDAVRDRAASFSRDLLQDTYEHYAGLKDSLDIEQIYAEYEDLAQLDLANRLREAPTELWRFGCETYLGNLTRAHQA